MFEIKTVFLKATEYLLSQFDKIHDTNYLMFLVSITFCLYGEKWFPSLYSSYVEWVGIAALISFFCLFLHFYKFVFEFLKNRYVKYKNKKIFELKTLKLLTHLSPEEEFIIKAMIASDKNNTMCISMKRHWCDLDRLYEQGILCHRKIQEYSVLESKVDCFEDPIMYEEYMPVRDYKMQDFVWEKVKSDPKWTAIFINKADEDDCPF